MEIVLKKKKKIHNNNSETLFTDISYLIEQSKQYISKEFNSTLLLLNWLIGNHINVAILNETRAEYGEQIINNLSTELTLKYGERLQ